MNVQSITHHIPRLLLPASLLCLGSCTALDRLNAPTLEGDPASTALIIVACPDVDLPGLFGSKRPQPATGAYLQNMSEPDPRFGGAVHQLAIFSHLPPGEYQLSGIATHSVIGKQEVKDDFEIPPEQAANIEVSARAGEAIFLGKVTLDVARPWMKPQSIVSHRDTSKEAELHAWNEFLQLYPGSIWEAAVKRRIAEISPDSASETPNASD
jgi:hypothetical protein